MWYLSVLDLLHFAWYPPDPSMLSQKVRFHSFLWPSSIPLCKCTTAFLIHSSVGGHLVCLTVYRRDSLGHLTYSVSQPGLLWSNYCGETQLALECLAASLITAGDKVGKGEMGQMVAGPAKKWRFLSCEVVRVKERVWRESLYASETLNTQKNERDCS